MGMKENVLTGVGASSGKAEGRVLIRKNDKPLHFMKDSVLVVVQLEPQIAIEAGRHVCAVIAETGGITCHGASVLREMGIPCIVGVKDATSILRDGMVVVVDGSMGEVGLQE